MENVGGQLFEMELILMRTKIDNFKATGKWRTANGTGLRKGLGFARFNRGNGFLTFEKQIGAKDREFKSSGGKEIEVQFRATRSLLQDVNAVTQDKKNSQKGNREPTPLLKKIKPSGLISQ